MALLQKNIGNADKTVRALIALVLFAFAYQYRSWIFFGLGLFVVFEVSFSWCVFYHLIGHSTHKEKKNK